MNKKLDVKIGIKVMEEWKSIVIYSKKDLPKDSFSNVYEVSNTGRIRQIAHAKSKSLYDRQAYHTTERTQTNNGQGYMQVSLYCDRGTFKFLVHRLVAFAFIGKPPKITSQVNHLDLTRANNHVDNLVYCTFEENMSHSVAERLRQSGGGYRDGYYAALALETLEMSEEIRLEYYKGLEMGARYCKVNSKRKVDMLLKSIPKKSDVKIPKKSKYPVKPPIKIEKKLHNVGGMRVLTPKGESPQEKETRLRRLRLLNNV